MSPPSPGPRPRPRDATGRPLPPGQADELGDGDPAANCRTVHEALERLDGCLAEGRYFAAHRVVLRLWRHLDADSSELWGAVAQLTGGCVHLDRDNLRGAQTLLERAADRLDAADSPQHGVDVAALAAAARRLAWAAQHGGGDPRARLDRLPRRS